MQLVPQKLGSFASSHAAARRPVVVLRSTRREDAVTQPAAQRLASFVASAALCAVLTVAPAHAAEAESTPAADKPSIEQQKDQISYILGQQDLVKKAEIAAKRQALATTKGIVTERLQRKLTEQRAGELAAASKGDTRELEAFKESRLALEEQEAELQKAAASYSAQLDRAEMIERARTIAASKKINAIAEALEKEQAATALAAAK